MAYDGTKPQDNSYIADGPAEIRENLRALKEDKIVNAQKLSDLEPGHSNGNIPVSDGVLNQGLNAELLNGYSVSDFAASNHAHSVVTSSSNGFMLNTDKVKLDDIATGAEVNQFAFSNISVGGTTISADTKQDTLTLAAGTGITLTPDATNDKVTINFNTATSITGNAATATKLQTARTINGVSFNGTANITITAAANGGTSSACSGNAATATMLATARNITVNLMSTTAASFNGTANVTPGVSGILPIASGGTGVSTGLPAACAPKPKAAAGVGQWCSADVSVANIVVPSGGTWAVFCAPNSSAYLPGLAGIYAGGSVLKELGSGSEARARQAYFLCWRIY